MLTALPIKILACHVKQITTKSFVHLAKNPTDICSHLRYVVYLCNPIVVAVTKVPETYHPRRNYSV